MWAPSRPHAPGGVHVGVRGSARRSVSSGSAADVLSGLRVSGRPEGILLRSTVTKVDEATWTVAVRHRPKAIACEQRGVLTTVNGGCRYEATERVGRRVVALLLLVLVRGVVFAVDAAARGQVAMALLFGGISTVLLYGVAASAIEASARLNAGLAAVGLRSTP